MRPETRRRLRAFLRYVELTIVYVVVIGGGLELATRIARPQHMFSSTVNAWDPRLGTRQLPGESGFISCDEYDINIDINSKGLRDHDFTYEKPAGVRRLLSLGDSFACGYGVPASETYAKVLERELRERGLNWEVLNAGVGSTGTAQQLAYFVDEGFKYSPDVVLVGFFVANDLWDNVTCGIYHLTDGHLVRSTVPRTGARRVQDIARHVPGYKFLLRRSHLLALIRYQVARWHAEQTAREGERDDEGTSEYAMKLTGALFARLRDACREHGARLVVMIIPGPEGASEACDRREARVRSILGDESIPCLDLGPLFRRVREESEIEYPHDKHWNAEGHKLAADTLLTFLDEHSLLSTGG